MFDYIFNGLEHFLIRETEYSEAQAFQELLANCVFFESIVMYRPIDFDYKLCLTAVKIYDELVDRMLPSKFRARNLPIAETFPETNLRSCRLLTFLAS